MRAWASRLTTLVVVTMAVAGFSAAPAGATWSLVAADETTGEVGAAIASCIDPAVLSDPADPLMLLVLEPGELAAVTQAQLNLEATGRIRQLHAGGLDPAAILADITSPGFDELASQRQHAIVSLVTAPDQDPVVAFTGDDTLADTGDAQGILVSVQGNLMASDTVVDESLVAFETARSDGGSLADALVAGLKAGADEGGDRRCGAQTARFAHVAVVGGVNEEVADSQLSASTMVLSVLVSEDGGNPVDELANAHEAGATGVIDQRIRSNEHMIIQVVTLVAGAAIAIAGLIFLRRGMGSVKARAR